MRDIGADDTLVRPRWARLQHCAVRERWVLLVPENVLFPCPATVEVLQRLAEPTRFGEIVAQMAAEYDASAQEISDDLAPLIGGLVEQGYVQRVDA